MVDGMMSTTGSTETAGMSTTGSTETATTDDALSLINRKIEKSQNPFNTCGTYMGQMYDSTKK